jgi:hypothetical protein
MSLAKDFGPWLPNYEIYFRDSTLGRRQVVDVVKAQAGSDEK